MSAPCRANCTDAAAAEPSRDQENPVNVPCHAPITSIRVNETVLCYPTTVVDVSRVMAPSFVIVDRVGGGGGMWPDGTNPTVLWYECIPTTTAAAAANRAVPRSGAPCDVPSRARPHPV